MQRLTKTVEVWSDDVPKSVTFPARHEVCTDCDGHGTTLAPSLRGAFTASEFNECFDDEESRAAYFERGGRYDVTCETCGGLRVTVEIDREAIQSGIDAELKRQLACFDAWRLENARWERERAAERSMGA